MAELIPQYRLLSSFYADDVLWPEGAIIRFDGVPNDQMEPLNEPARKALEIYLTALEEGRIRAGHKKNFDMSDIVYDAMSRRPKAEEIKVEVGAVEMPFKQDVPMMPGMPLSTQSADLTRPRGRPKKNAVEMVEQEADQRVASKKPPVMGTIVRQSEGGDINSGGGFSA